MTLPEPKTTNEKRTDDASNSDAGRSVAVCQNRINSRDLFVATREIIIAHGEEAYRLRLTAQNKLILTK